MTTLLAHAPRLWSYLQLVRPANVVTALADVLAGFAASGLALFSNGEAQAAGLTALAWLLIATAGLYAGGITFNDVFDAELDAAERPERPIPSGQVSRGAAAWLGGILLFAGVLAALQVSEFSAILAATIALTALLYDAYGKYLSWFGPLNMGACRGLNLLLGMSAAPALVTELWFIALLPIAYIAAVTTVSQGEVHGGKRHAGVAALLLMGLVSAGLFALEWVPEFTLVAAAPFLIILWWRVVPSFVIVARNPRPDHIRAAVKTGVTILIVLNASIAAGFAGVWYGLVVLLLLPASIGLARSFAVT